MTIKFQILLKENEKFNDKFFSQFHKGRILYFSQLSDGNLISTSTDKTIKIINPNTKEVIATLADHKDWVWKVIEFKDKLISISWDNTLKIWKKENNNYVVENTIEIKGNPFDIISLINDEFDVAVCVDEDKSLRFINLSNKNEIKIENVVVNVEKFDEIMFINQNILLVAAKNNLYLIDIKTKQILCKLENNENKIEKIFVNDNFIYAVAKTNENKRKLLFFKINDNKISKFYENDLESDFEDKEKLNQNVKDLIFKENEMKQIINSQQ